MTGAFICTLSPEDWETTRYLGVYGNRLLKEGTRNQLKDPQKLSIVRDLISMKTGDLVFFHIRDNKTIHGIYRVRGEPYYDSETKIWSNEAESFPFRFLFEPHPDYKHLAELDAHIGVDSLYECIDSGKIRSLVTLENERNIESRGVRKILFQDALIISKMMHRDLKRSSRKVPLGTQLHRPSSGIPLRQYVYAVGRQENAVKSVLVHELRNNLSFVQQTFSDAHISLDEVDFVIEFFVAQTTRKSIDIYCVHKNRHILMEVKSDKLDRKALQQVLYYRDLLFQRPWMDRTEDTITVVLVGRRFESGLDELVRRVSTVANGVRLLRYEPIHSGTWASFSYAI